MTSNKLGRPAARAGAAALMALAVAAAGSARANPTITALYDPHAGFSAADQTTIQNAIDFYTSNITSTFSLTVAFGSQAFGGGSSQWFTTASTYNDFYNALTAHSSGDATDVSALASLGGGAHTNNPVTGSGAVITTSTLGALLGLNAQISDVFASCGGVAANACVTLSHDALNASGAPLAGLFGIVQHELDEVLGTASNLPNGGGAVPSDPLAADLYRFAGNGVRSFALNSSTDVPCTGAPTAYLSVDGGATNLQSYNNCNNGGDYGDWIGVDGALVQDAFGPDTQAASLSLSSPEITLLDAVGYNFNAASTPPGAPEPETWALMLLGFGAMGAAMRGRRRVPHDDLSGRPKRS